MDPRHTNIRYLKGIGEAKAKYFEKLDITTIGDLISHFPRGYEDRSAITEIESLQPNLPCCIRATVCAAVTTQRGRSGITFCRTRAADDTGKIDLTFFNATYIRDSLIRGETYVFYGKPQISGRKFEMINPVFEPAEKSGASETSATGRIMPVYPLTAGLPNSAIVRAQAAALDLAIPSMPDPIPHDVRMTHSLCQIEYAYRSIHFPRTMEDAEKARQRFAFEELFLLTIGLDRLRGRRDTRQGTPLACPDTDAFASALPFTLTNAQQRCIREAIADMSPDGNGKPKPPMRRLVQGDVGSGKTMVAAACAYAVVRSGHQCVLMAPTEILASQHYEGLSKLFDTFAIPVVFLSGSLKAAEKRAVKAKIASGEAKLVIGTHALLTEDVAFADLKLVIADEQHRFGVRQRVALSQKGENAHILVMSATPIPRTLALMLYGDLDVSVVDELPPGRTPVYTRAVKEEQRATIYDFVRKQFLKGRQGYVVCPLIEDNEGGNNLKAVEAYAKELKERIFPDFPVEYLHGKMSEKQKNETMLRFKAGEIKLLVSTTVIEVGVDVPNATMMLIENAERFGLSQLHQLRGRVGRGQYRGYCVLFSDENAVNETTAERLKAMEDTTDGFEIARRDLAIRGPGEFFGERQSGTMPLKIANLGADMRLLTDAQSAAKALLKADPTLADYPALRDRVAEMFAVEDAFH